MKKEPKEDITEAGPNVQIPGNRCYRCGHEWRPRNMNVVCKVCPSCKSVYWDTPRRKRKDSAKR